ncbi:MAG: helix-turn-helix domain-containing protein [Ruminococcaceae bacterium]|nr:helix-turn-helix domain-containing protein [Oscillospiraceae bacterium]
MDYSITAEIIRKARIRSGITQKELAARLGVTNTAVSKWERGLGMPDVSLLLPLCDALRITVSALLGKEDDGSVPGRTDCLTVNQIDTPTVGERNEENAMTFEIDTGRTMKLSPYVFGHNLEHTRSAVAGSGGLSAQMLRNRKFAGKSGKNSGVAAEWRGIGDRAFFQLGGRPCYTRHIGCERMVRRGELNSQSVQNVHGGLCGLTQRDLAIVSGKRYEIRAVTMCSVPVALAVELTDRKGETVYARAELSLVPGDWETHKVTLDPDTDDSEAAVRFVFTERAEVIFGALSMMPEDNFHGMRLDAVRCLKEIGPTILRWPGGNFAGEYRWKDGLLPSDMRGPLQAAMEIESEPHSHGYDFHEISTDDFVALCREIGAEPFLTINLVWNSTEDSADWVEYCNGSADTEYGRRRVENGYPDPYGVRFWSLGNEMGYSHMEGPRGPEEYAALAATHVEAMKAVSPDIELFSSGPYPNDQWAEKSAAKLAADVKTISLHHYAQAAMDYTTPEKIADTYKSIVASVSGAEDLARWMRRSLDATGEKLLISFDEWNFWYAWYRPSCVGEGIFAAKMLHMLLSVSNELDIPYCCYFQPVGEGAILIDEDGARLTANGQMFAMMKAHCGGNLCALTGADRYSAVATEKDGVLTLTLINDSFDTEKAFCFNLPGKDPEGELYASEEVTPYTCFEKRPLDVKAENGHAAVVLPPHSAAKITVRIGR